MTEKELHEKLMPLLAELDCVKDPAICTKEHKAQCPLTAQESNECIRDLWEWEEHRKTGEWPII